MTVFNTCTSVTKVHQDKLVTGLFRVECESSSPHLLTFIIIHNSSKYSLFGIREVIMSKSRRLHDTVITAPWI